MSDTMGDSARKGSSSPLLESSSASAAGSASSIQTLGNIVVSIVGTGVLGLPFAFKVAGWLAGAVGVIVAGVSTYYCMLILVSDSKFILLSGFSFSYHLGIEFVVCPGWGDIWRLVNALLFRKWQQALFSTTFECLA